jgi:hypothetical protein
MRKLVALAITLAGCGGATSGGKPTPPTLDVTAPARGTTVNGSSVTVTGTAAGTDVAVTVMGSAVRVGSDGSFSTVVTVPSGISVIETDAIDKSGTKLTDTRAVLAGNLAMSDGSLVAPIGAFANAAALSAVGKAVASEATSIDFTTLAQSLNPVYTLGGCPGATVNITGVSIGGVDVGLTPSSSGLVTAVTLDNVSVSLRVAFQVGALGLCVSGGDTVMLTASAAHINGDIGVDVSSGKLATSVSNAALTFDNFNLAIGSVPSVIVDLFRSDAQSAVQTLLTGAVQTELAPILNAGLASLLGQPINTTVLGAQMQIDVTPLQASISSSGLLLAANTKVTVSGGSHGVFVPDATPFTASVLAQSTGLGIALANDLANQLFAGLWAAGAIDLTVPLSDLSLLGAVLDQNAQQLQVSLSLPPMVSSDANGNLQLAVGDAMINVEDGSGNQLQQVALSLFTAISAGPSNGQVALALATPTVYAQVLDQANDGSRPLTDTEVEGLVTGAWGVLDQQLSTALASMPLPSIAGIQLGAPTVGTQPGFIVVDLPLQ